MFADNIPFCLDNGEFVTTLNNMHNRGTMDYFNTVFSFRLFLKLPENPSDGFSFVSSDIHGSMAAPPRAWSCSSC